MKSILICIVFAILLVGCASPDKVMQSYLDHHYSELVANWGPPHEKMSDGKDGEIWTYYYNRQYTTPGYANTSISGNANSYGNVYRNPYGASYSGNSTVYGNATTTYTPPQVHNVSSRRTFFVNGEGMIYRYAWQGR